MSGLIIGLVIAGLFVVVLLWFVGMFNVLVRKRIDCDNGWSQIDVQLKRRYDLIPESRRDGQGVRGARAGDAGRRDLGAEPRRWRFPATRRTHAEKGRAEGALTICTRTTARGRGGVPEPQGGRVVREVAGGADGNGEQDRLLRASTSTTWWRGTRSPARRSRRRSSRRSSTSRSVITSRLRTRRSVRRRRCRSSKASHEVTKSRSHEVTKSSTHAVAWRAGERE
jgi:hypothetical protein